MKIWRVSEPMVLSFHLLVVNPGRPETVQGNKTPDTFAATKTAITDKSIDGVISNSHTVSYANKGGIWKPNATMNIIVINLRNKLITHRIPIEDCGNGVVNAT
jgi:hypothetical protein